MKISRWESWGQRQHSDDSILTLLEPSLPVMRLREDVEVQLLVLMFTLQSGSRVLDIGSQVGPIVVRGGGGQRLPFIMELTPGQIIETSVRLYSNWTQPATATTKLN